MKKHQVKKGQDIRSESTRIGDYEVVPVPDSISEVRYICSYMCVILIAYTHCHKCYVTRITTVCLQFL